MKTIIQLITRLVCIALCQTAVQAAVSYWDIDGATTGAGGATPAGTWDVGTTANWSTDAAGGVASTTWADTDDAIFSAGTDATGAFTVALSGTPIAGNLTVEEGAVTIAGSTTLNVGNRVSGKGTINVLATATLTINTTVTGGNNSGMLSLIGTNTGENTINGLIVNSTGLTRVEKRETGTWVLSGLSTFTGVCDIRDGTLSINSVANVNSPSAIGTGGAGGAHPIIGLGGLGVTNATLRYTGTGHSTSREIRLWGATAAGGGAVEASGTGPLVLRGDVSQQPTAAFDKVLTLKGANTGTNTLGGQINNSSGGAKTSVIKEGVGKWVLAGNNSYTGTTAVNGGTLLVNGSGAIAAAGSVSVNASATLGGTGTIYCPVTVNPDGNLSPGASVGTLGLNGDLTLSGNLLIEVDKSLSPSNDVVIVAGTLTNAGTGTVTVANLGPALAAGDTFYLFRDGSNNNKPLPNGQALTVVSAGGVVWTNKLAVDGSIAVVSAPPAAAPATNLTIAAAGPASFNLGGSGAANSAYNVYASTNVTTPMTNWWLIGITNSNGGGVIQFLDSQATNAQRFYRFGQ